MAEKLTPIIVLNWNGIDDTIQCVNSIKTQSYKHWRLLLVDNGSDKYNVDTLKEKYNSDTNIELIFFHKNMGFAKAHNKVFRDFILNSNYDYVALLNNDAVASPHWLKELVNYSEKHGGTIISSKMLSFHHPELIDNTGHIMLNTGEIIPRSFGLKDDNDLPHKLTNIGACAGAALYCTSTLKRIGVFDNYFNTGYEDAEFGLRAFLCGEKMIYCPNAVVHHKMGQSIKKVKDNNYLIYIQCCVFYTYFKLMPLRSILYHLPFIIFKYTIVIIVDLLFLRISSFKRISTALLLSYKDRKRISKARKSFFRVNSIIRSTKEINSELTFFLWFDIKRFLKYVIMNNKSLLEE